MIAKISGEISHIAANWIVIETSGVGYKVFCNTGQIKSGPAVLFTYHYIREDQQSLYGFLSLEELALFELLITVNGVGPKAALAIMSSSSADRIKQSIASGDSGLFKAVSGIGPKVAAKIIVELKNKIGKAEGNYLPNDVGESQEIFEALTSLGYTQVEILTTLKNLPADITDTTEQINWVLKYIGHRSK